MNIGTGSLNDAAMAQSSVQEAELRSRHREIEASRRTLNGGPVDKEKKLRDACEGFEAVFIQKMWEGMRASLPKDGLITGGRDEKTWQGMYDQELGKSMAKAGGIGLADMMMTQLSRNLQNASEVAATSAARREPMAIAPVPLLPPKATQETTNEAAKAAVSSATTRPLHAATDIYGGEALQPDAPALPEEASATASQQATLPGGATTPQPVQSALDELAARVGQPSPAASGTMAGTIGGTATNGVQGVSAASVASPGTGAEAAAASAALQPSGVAPPVVQQTAPYLPPQKVRRPSDGMPRASRRSSNLRTSADNPANQANMTYGPNIANSRVKPAVAEKTNTSSTPATNLMKEQMS